MKRVVSLLLCIAASGCMIRPHAGGGFDEPGYHPQRKIGIYLPPGAISSDARVAAVQVGLLLVAGVSADLRPGVGSARAPHVPGKTGVVRGSGTRHPNAYLPPAEATD